MEEAVVQELTRNKSTEVRIILHFYSPRGKHSSACLVTSIFMSMQSQCALLQCNFEKNFCHFGGRGESVEANLRQYGLEHRYVDMLVADAASSIWRHKEIFDAIVTDRKHFLLSLLWYYEY